MRGKLSFTSETDLSILHTSYEMSSPSFILPDSPPPQRVLNYWQRKAAESCAGLSAAAAAAAASAASPASSSASPLKRQGIFVQRERGEEIIIGDSPLPQSLPTTWALRRAVLTTLSNSIRERQAKRKLTFEEPEVSGEEEEEVLTQSKKRVPEENSSMLPLMEEVRRREEEEAENEMDVETEELLAIINHTEKPWTSLRQLVEDTPYPIVGVWQITNQHGRRVILKVHLTSVRLTDIYMPESTSFVSPCFACGRSP
ncbi:uncharacterized protein LOC120354722 [Nilaparvata lugens]|uniref:uncharacterized protein LOC120354722 n=1 Tax=Nilaparvata lugens TaxID=108931 RepID=UPI00193EA60C|nr:uncharacterized protein LOC120354722 [Nilaparvata lugens]